MTGRGTLGRLVEQPFRFCETDDRWNNGSLHRNLRDQWVLMKKSPESAREIAKEALEGSRWEKWGKANFFKTVTRLGTHFEDDICRLAFRKRDSPDYLRLRAKVDDLYKKGLNDYEMFSQVQLKYDGEKYFVGDQLFVKYKLNDKGQRVVDDIIVIENKLSKDTNLTSNQRDASLKGAYTVRSQEAKSQTEGIPTSQLVPETVIQFGGDIQWIKVWDTNTGDIIEDMGRLK